MGISRLAAGSHGSPPREWPVIKIEAKSNKLVEKFNAPRNEEGIMGDAIRYGAGSVWGSGRAPFRINPYQ
ncbi:hypothetical protein SAMN05216228_106917 [Rhizobium tibeticum]|uniref:Uncharacterized protein n=1 Tax=Rhizobium tibeticum TaxID=501024 RepID=A0A1H8WLI5_9HYPH|nr:hypothetical protein RTCCBAU85039_6580 [Rhizobium tibeticum]SEP28540.1 hypothetical protein SAMN05216228_106917 [Rhizobium tibeticum]